MQLMVTLLSMQLSNGISTSIGIVSAVFIMFYIRVSCFYCVLVSICPYPTKRGTACENLYSSIYELWFKFYERPPV